MGVACSMGCGVWVWHVVWDVRCGCGMILWEVGVVCSCTHITTKHS